MRTIKLAVGPAVLAAALFGIAGCSSGQGGQGHGRGPAASAASAAASGPAGAPSAGASGAGSVAASAAAPSASSAADPAALSAWFHRTGDKVETDFLTEAFDLGKDAHDTAAETADCRSVGRTESAAAKDPAPPDASVAAAWRRALQQIHEGAADCVAGKSSGVLEISTGLAQIEAVKSQTR